MSTSAGQPTSTNLKGRVLKVDLTNDELYIGAYDYDNGEGAAAKALEELYKTGDVNPVGVRAAHHEGKLAAAFEVKQNLGTKSEMTGNVLSLGFGDVKDILAPAVNRAVRTG